MQENIGAKIAELRREHNMKQDELAEMLGVTPQAVSKWENGASMPDISLLPKIAQIFGVTIDDLFGVNNTPKPDVQMLPAEKRKSFDEMILRIRVQDGGDKVNVNLPLPLVKLALEIGMTMPNVNTGNVDLSKVDFNHIIKLVENGVIGKLVEVEGSGGETVVIEVC
ncbi:MAG: helix-turn-helix transcriptional regulator [Ruminococcaceae bacterium]|nr:helix-turn-helix transcriptional regulator [Oscillospiraceae bacterium]